MLNGGIKMIITREKILEERCNNYRTVIEDLCRRNGLSIFTEVRNYYIHDNLSDNDARYLLRACDVEESVKSEKPPVGVLPREKWDKKRQDELMNGIYNCIAVNKLPPLEWLEELIEILDRMEKTNE